MERKNNKSLVVALMLAIIVILGLVLYICYDKEVIFSNNNTNEEPENVSENDEETEDVNSNTDNSNNSLSAEDELNTDENGINAIYNQKKCYGTYYGESSGTQDNGISWNIKATYVLNPDGTYSADYGTSFDEGIYVTIANTIVFIGPKHTFGPEDQDPHYYPENYVIADDCSYFIASNQNGLILRKQ